MPSGMKMVFHHILATRGSAWCRQDPSRKQGPGAASAVVHRRPSLAALAWVQRLSRVPTSMGLVVFARPAALMDLADHQAGRYCQRPTGALGKTSAGRRFGTGAAGGQGYAYGRTSLFAFDLAS